MSGNEEFIQEFLVECEENLDQLDQDLVALEENPRDQERLASIFRTIHTIKGTSGFFGFAKLGAVAHAGENLLGRLRDGDLLLNPDLTNALLQLVDAVREILAAIERDGNEGPGDYSSVVARLELLAAQSALQVSRPLSRADERSVRAEEVDAALETTNGIEQANVAAAKQFDTDDAATTTPSGRVDESTGVAASGDTTSATTGHETAESAAKLSAPSIQGAEDGAEPRAAHNTRDGELSAQQPSETFAKEQFRAESPETDAVEDHGRRISSGEAESDLPEPRSAEPLPISSTPTSTTPTTSRTIRVDVDLLNELMNQVGELVLARNQIRPFADTIDDRVFNSALQQLDLITGDLQEGIMKTRMQPIGNLWTRLPRVVRDLAQSRGKQVQLEMHGHETELDRTLIEALKDPLTHLVRNAVDHGIESPEARREAGKPEMGSVVLRAFHEGGMVNIELADDGAGIDPEKVREKALRMGLVSPDLVRRMTSHQITQLIFLPGLSTAERVTDISGRGVGMDVVKTNIERIGGSVAIDSHAGQGTTLRIKIPLTLAIIPALMVTDAAMCFAIPQVSLREIITLFEGLSAKHVETIGDQLVYRLRGELLPLIQLADVLRTTPETGAKETSQLHIIVLNAIGQRFGIVVDGVGQTEEIVVKPLHKALSRIPVFSGATVLGNGRVALILDVVGLARSAGLDQRDEMALDESLGDDSEKIAAVESVDLRDDFLICEAGAGRRIAVPLADVTRLEELTLDAELMRQADKVVPYRGKLMHLLHGDDFHPQRLATDEQICVVVHDMGDRCVGLLVERILDVAPATQSIDTIQKRPGMIGRTLVDGEVVDIVDIKTLARLAGISVDSTRNVEMAR